MKNEELFLEDEIQDNKDNKEEKLKSFSEILKNNISEIGSHKEENNAFLYVFENKTLEEKFNFFRDKLLDKTIGKERQDVISSYIIEVAREFSRLGEVNKALETIGLISDKRRNDIGLRYVATDLARVGKFDEAEEVIKLIGGSYRKAIALKELAKYSIEFNNSDLAIKEIGKTEELLKTIERLRQKTYILRELAKLSILIGDIEGVNNFNDKAKKITLKNVKRENRTIDLESILEIYKKAGNIEGVNETTKELEEDYRKKINVFKDLKNKIKNLIKKDEKATEIESLLKEVRSLIESTPIVSDRVYMLRETARIFVALGNEDKVREFLDEAKNEVESSNIKEGQKTKALSSISQVFRELNKRGGV